MSQRNLCPLCKAGVTQQLAPSPEYSTSKNPRRFGHPGYPLSRICALAHYKCGDQCMELLAWDPSPTDNRNSQPLEILSSHILTVDDERYIERPRVSINAEELAQAGLKQVCIRADTLIWHYKFRPLS